MTINPIDPIAPVPGGFDFAVRPYSGIRPFVFVWGRTHEDTLEDLRLYVRKVVEHINAENIELNQSLNVVINDLIALIDNKLDAQEIVFNKKVEDLVNLVNAALAEVDKAVEDILNSSANFNDQVVNTIFNNKGEFYTSFVRESKDLSSAVSFIVAPADAPASVKARAHLVLNNINNSAMIENALKVYRKVHFAPGTIPLNADIDVVGVDDIRITGRAKFITPKDSAHGGGRFAAIRIRATDPTPVPINGFTAANLEYGSRVVNIASSDHGLKPGDYVQFRSTENHNPARPQWYFKGEINRVIEATATAITFAGSLMDNYMTAMLTLRKINPLRGLYVRDIHIQAHPETTNRQNGFLTTWALDADIQNVSGEGHQFSDGFGAWGCIGGVMSYRADNMMDSMSAGRDTTGYGARIGGSVGMEIRAYGANCRHIVDVGNSSADYPVGRFITVKGEAERCYGAAFSSHDGEYITFDEIVALNCGGGITARSPFTTIIRPKIIGGHRDVNPWYPNTIPNHAINIGGENGRAGEGLYILDPIIDMTNQAGQAGSGQAGAANINGITLRDPLVNAKVIVTSPIKVAGRPVNVYCEASYDTEIRVVVDSSAFPNNTEASVLISPDAPRDGVMLEHKRLTVDLVAKGIKGHAIRMSTGQKNGGVTEDIRIGYTVSGIDPVANAGAGRVQISANATFGEVEVYRANARPLTEAQAFVNQGVASSYYFMPGKYRYSAGAIAKP